MSIFKRINDYFNNDSDQPDDQPTKVVWTKISEPVQEDHSEEYRQLKSQRITPWHITSLEENEVFVFGSNVYGMHCGGASEYAVNYFGAIMGQAYGPQGRSYAIPTDGPELQEIAVSILGFISYAKNNPEQLFLVTAIGCGTAGYSVKEIAPLFLDAVPITNICLPAEFWRCINENSQEYIIKDFQKAWQTFNASYIIKHLHPDFIYDSQWVFESLDYTGYVDYILGKFRTLTLSSSKIETRIVEDLRMGGCMLELIQNNNRCYYRIKIKDGKVIKGDLCMF